jgi:hypothetical protein
MSKLLFLMLALLVTSTYFAQAPQRLNYQSIVRDETGELVASQKIDVRISILQGSEVGNTVYTETHNLMTNENGLATFGIGEGVTADVFANIDWGNGPFFIKTETAPEGGANYTISGVSQLMSVPYALYATKSGVAPGTAVGDMQYWDGTKWVMLPVGSQGKVLTSNNGAPAWGDAATSTGGTIIKGAKNGDMLVWKDTSWVILENTPLSNRKSLFNCDGNPSWGGCLPEVKTFNPENVGSISATLGVGIIDDGGNQIIASGIVWSENKNPTLADSVISLGSGKEDKFISFKRFQTNKIYHVRAYATTIIGTNYGLNEDVKTVTSKPVVVSNAIEKSYGQLHLSGTMTDNGGDTSILKYGICYNTTGNPTNADSVITSNIMFQGMFNTELPSMSRNTTYYYRVFVTTKTGTGYGNIVSYFNPKYKIGDNAQGGIVFYVDSSGNHGLVAAPTDLLTNCDTMWINYDSDYDNNGNSYSYYGMLKPNSINLQYVCDNLVLNGYDDWRFPDAIKTVGYLLPYTASKSNPNNVYNPYPAVQTDIDYMIESASIINLSKSNYATEPIPYLHNLPYPRYYQMIKYNVWSDAWNNSYLDNIESVKVKRKFNTVASVIDIDRYIDYIIGYSVRPIRNF